MLRKSILTSLCLLIGSAVMAQNQADIDAILSMAGEYKVSFDFAETFSPIEGYEYHDRKREEAIEYVGVVENTKTKIVLQHILVVNDTMVVKHWRQDWVYEPTTLLEYQMEDTWKLRALTKEESKGKWAQKVYQVDDSPRYEGIGTWVHVDGKHYWESVADAPLPRREYTKRSDYNVLRRHSRMEITDYGWVLEQDNAKIVRENGTDKIICWEKGMEQFHKGDYDCTPATEYWTKNAEYWSVVREEWDNVFTTKKEVMLAAKVDDVRLFMALFGLCSQHESDPMNDEALRNAVKETISKYVI